MSFDLILLLAAAFGAGVLNTLAGGGTFLTFPALVFAGVPPVAASATSTVVVFPGYFGGALGFRRELMAMPVRRILRLAAITVAGGIAGSTLLLVSSNAVFSLIVPVLLLAATLLFLFGDRLRRLAERRTGALPEGVEGEPASTFRGVLGVLAVAIYGGYFNGGLGIMLLAVFAVQGMRDILAMNGLKSGLSFLLSAISVTAFAAGGLVLWSYALPMMVASTAGGYLGAPLARRMPKRVLRALIGAVGFGMTAIFAWRALG